MIGEQRETTLEDLDIDNIDFDELSRQIEAHQKLKNLRNENPWVRDIIRVLWSRSWISMDQLTKELWALREPSGLTMPEEFKKTVQSALNSHTSQSKRFKGRAENDLFFSPEGKNSGTWAVRRKAAVAWLNARKFPEV